jgi:hypothetical protein
VLAINQPPLAQRGLAKLFFEELGPAPRDRELRKEKKIVNNQNRVLIRRGARELTPTEAELVNGGFRTLSLCTSSPSPDGDQHVGEVGC